MKRITSLVTLLVLVILTAACAGEEPAPTEAPPLVPTEKPVPEVLATEPPRPTDMPTTVPEPAESELDDPAVVEAGSIGITPKQISLDTQGLPYSWNAVTVAETPYDESMPPGPKGLPEHIEILFGVSSPAERQPNSPIMYIIPVNAYRELWDEAGNTSVSEMISLIEQTSFALPEPAPTSGIAALPFEEIGGVNDLAVQLGHAAPQDVVNQTSATQTGYRFVGRWAQDANPVTNQGLR